MSRWELQAALIGLKKANTPAEAAKAAPPTMEEHRARVRRLEGRDA